MNPLLVADRVILPALRPNRLEERGQVTDREQGVTLNEETETSEDIVTEVSRDGAERVLLEHAADDGEFAPSLGVALLVDPSGLFAGGQVSPVGLVGGVRVGGEEDGVEGLGGLCTEADAVVRAWRL